MSTSIQTSPASFDLLAMDRRIERRIVRRRAAQVAAYLGVAAVGLRKGGVIGWVGAGLGLLALVRELVIWRDQQPEWRRAAFRGPEALRRLFRTSSRDSVDRASANSFPASDAVSHDIH